jgi:hypothetical protein
VAHVRHLRWPRRVVRWLARQEPDPSLDLLDVIDASLHVDLEAICPDCLQWIGPADFVRRNVIGLLEHEVCPPAFVIARRR